MADDQLEISIVLDDGSVRQGFARIKNEGQDTSGQLTAAFGSLTKTVAALAAAFLGLRSLKNLFAEGIAQAEGQQNAINRLNTSLALAGSFSQQASQSFQDLASQIQSTTVVADDQALSLAALARNFTKTNDQAKQLTLAAIDLAAATGVDVNTALEQLGGTFNGVTGRLGKLIPEIKTLTKEQLEAGAAVQIFAARFAGAAGGELQTFSGRITQLKNNFGDFLEELGNIVVRSPATIAVIKVISDRIVSLTQSFRDFVGNRDFIGAFISQLAEIGQGFVKFVIAPAELAFNILRNGFLAIASLGTGVIALFGKIAEKIVTFFGPNSSAAKAFKEFSDSATATFETTFQSLSDSANNTLSFDVSASTDKLLEDVKLAADSAIPAFEGLKNNVTDPITQNAIPTITQLFQTARTEFGLFSETLNNLSTDQINQKIEQLKESFKKLGVEGRNALGQGIGSGFAQFGQALVKGENAVEAFAKAFIGAIGQQAIASGTRFILEGLAYLTIPGFQGVGGAMIAAGSALATFGGVLSAFAGGQNTGAGGGAAGAASGQLQEQPSLVPDDLATDQQSQRIVVNVQGDVLDSRESGLRIVELINEAFDTQGAQVTARA